MYIYIYIYIIVQYCGGSEACHCCLPAVACRVSTRAGLLLLFCCLADCVLCLFVCFVCCACLYRLGQDFGLRPSSRTHGRSQYEDYGLRRVSLKQNLNLKRWNSQAHREFPGKFESSNLSRDNPSREIGRSLETNSDERLESSNGKCLSMLGICDNV